LQANVLFSLHNGSPEGDNSGGTKTKGFGAGRGDTGDCSWLLAITRFVISFVRYNRDGIAIEAAGIGSDSLEDSNLLIFRD
jgi:hypothetical protein